MVHAGLDAAREERQRAARVCEEDLQRGVAVEDAGEVGARDGDGGFEREAEGEGEDVAGAGDVGGAAEGGVGEAVMGMEKNKCLGLCQREI